MIASQSATYYLKIRWFLIAAGIILLAIWTAVLALVLSVGGGRLRMITPMVLLLMIGGVALLAQGLTYRVTVSAGGIEVRYFHWRFAAAWDALERSEADRPSVMWLVLRQPPAPLPQVWFLATPEHLRGRAIPLLRAWRGGGELERRLREHAPQLFAAVGETGAPQPGGLSVPSAPRGRRLSRLQIGVLIGAVAFYAAWLWLFIGSR